MYTRHLYPLDKRWQVQVTEYCSSNGYKCQHGDTNDRENWLKTNVFIVLSVYLGYVCRVGKQNFNVSRARRTSYRNISAGTLNRNKSKFSRRKSRRSKYHRVIYYLRFAPFSLTVYLANVHIWRFRSTNFQNLSIVFRSRFAIIIFNSFAASYCAITSLCLYVQCRIVIGAYVPGGVSRKCLRTCSIPPPYTCVGRSTFGKICASTQSRFDHEFCGSLNYQIFWGGCLILAFGSR
jgi:hypothetical protein